MEMEKADAKTTRKGVVKEGLVLPECCREKNQSWPATGAQAEGNEGQHQLVWWLLVVGSVFRACRSICKRENVTFIHPIVSCDPTTTTILFCVAT